MVSLRIKYLSDKIEKLRYIDGKSDWIDLRAAERVELKAGDMISVVASPVNASRFFKTIGIETNQVKNTMIIGGGKISFYLAKRLLEMGIQVKIIEKDRDACERLCEILPKAMIILSLIHI